MTTWRLENIIKLVMYLKLSELTKGMAHTCWTPGGSEIYNLEITGVVIDSRRAVPGCLFVCLKGGAVDGHGFIGEAVAKGAAVVVCGYVPDNAPEGAVYLVTEDTREALAVLAGNYFGNPQKGLTLIGVTGTKGKTSVTYYIKRVLEAAGIRAGIIGTTGIFAGERELDIKFQTSSTPDTPELYQILRALADEGVTHVVMEATSHGLDQRRTAGLHFSLGIFTNLTHDHLDYHKSFEGYAKAKGLLFRQSGLGLVNADDAYASAVIEGAACGIVYFGIENRREGGYFAEDAELLPDGVRFSVSIGGKKRGFALNVPGRFSVYNALAAIAAGSELGISAEVIAAGLAGVAGVPGRFEQVSNNRGLRVIVDYAHTPDSLRNIITAVREFTPGRVITLFGCGGDRDREKRPVMGRIAGELSDVVVLTSDNPRNEEPMDIIQEILPGLAEKAARRIVEPDRERAIYAALAEAEAGDAVIIAGKGHEPYQEFENRRRIPFSDRKIAENAML